MLKLGLILIALMGFATPALADPKSDSIEIYNVAVVQGVALTALLDKIDAPIATADTIELQIKTPLNEAQQTWLDIAFNSGIDPEPYRQFQPCYNSADLLGEMAIKVQRYLRGIDKQVFTAADAEPFKAAIVECEIVLGLEPSF